MLFFNESDKFGFKVHTGREKVWEFHEDAFLMESANFEEGAFMAVEVTSDDAYLATIHGGGDFVREVVNRIF